MIAPNRAPSLRSLALRAAWIALCVVVAHDAARADVPSLASPEQQTVRTKTSDIQPRVSASQGVSHLPSDVIYPSQTLSLNFDHRPHLAHGMRCLDCHTKAATSAQSSDRLLPSGTVCDRCHQTDHRFVEASGAEVPRASASCAVCHAGHRIEDAARVRPTIIPSPLLHFSHRAHAVRNIGCPNCHGQVARTGQSTREQLPTMRSCFVCHNQPAQSRGEARAECSTCHLADTSGRLKTALPTGKMMPPRWLGSAEHGPDFASRHGSVAANNSKLCANCHAESECVACHDGRLRPRSIHPNDFISMHALAARQESQSCVSCHRSQSFCQSCHQRAGVTMSGAAFPRSVQGRFHPSPEQFTNGPRNPRHHAWEAQRNIGACVSCHTERDCVQCHGSRGGGGLGVNPHPAGFIARCGSALSRNPRPCLVCHDPSESSIRACR